MADSENLSPVLIDAVHELRRVVEVEVKAGLAQRWNDEGKGATEIAQLLGVSRQTVYRYLKRESGSQSKAPVNGHEAEDAVPGPGRLGA